MTAQRTSIQRTWKHVCESIRTRLANPDKELTYIEEFSISEEGIQCWRLDELTSKYGWSDVVVTKTDGAILHINVYIVDRAYGGSEEGGWYFTCYQIEKCIPIMVPGGSDFCEYVKAEFNRWNNCYSNEGRRPISSVLSDGEYHVRVELTEAESETKEKPRYC